MTIHTSTRAAQETEGGSLRKEDHWQDEIASLSVPQQIIAAMFTQVYTVYASLPPNVASWVTDCLFSGRQVMENQILYKQDTTGHGASSDGHRQQPLHWACNGFLHTLFLPWATAADTTRP
jgi:hypothetical protein